MNVWARVTKSAPCPICKKGDWCCIDKDTGAVCCMRVESDKSLANGGWLHNGKQCPPRPPQSKPIGYDAPEFDVDLWWRSVRFIIRQRPMEEWAKNLSLPVDAMDLMGTCILAGKLCFPMFDGHGKVCGIRTRDKLGNKRAITGSKAGVFLSPYYGDEETIICEGPTDATAALALGFWSIGRPSCLGSERHVVDTCRRYGIRQVTLCADGDGPGIAGAKKLEDTLRAAKISVRMVTPSNHKDLRDWYKAGATRAIVDAQWSQAEWRH